jgi:uncharacterized protein (TIGR00725 family)
MARKFQISVIGFDTRLCTAGAYAAAYRVGREVAKQGGIVIDGGLGGVMEAACKGAREGGGFSVGIVPSSDSAQANQYCDAVIATGFGFARNFPVVYSGDAVIIVGGGAGTLTEVAAAYGIGKRIVAVAGTGGTADKWAGMFMDGRKTVRILKARSPEGAVRKAMRISSSREKVRPG